MLNTLAKISGDSLVQSLFPREVSCRICGRYFPQNRLLSGLCPFCIERWQQMRLAGLPCPRCGSFFWPNRCLGPCSQGFTGFTGVTAAAPYRGIYRNMLLELKYDGRRELAETMGFLMALAWEEREEALRPPADFLIPGKRPGSLKTPWLIPVPLHRGKAERRGYNQSLLLAEAVGKNLRLPVKEILYRTRAGKVQAGLDQEERKTALNGLFCPMPGYLPDPGQPLILVDDVITTGATLLACRQALDPQKALWIKALTFAAGAGAQADNYS